MNIRGIRAASAALFRTRATVLVAVPALAAGGLLAIGAPAAYAAPDCSVTAIAASINMLAEQAGDANQQLSSLDSRSSAQQVQAAGAALSMQLSGITDGLYGDADSLSGCPPLGDADAEAVTDAFSNAVGATEALLSTIGQKHDIFAQFLLTAPIAGQLRNLEGAVDTYASMLSDLAPSQAGKIVSIQDRIDNALARVISQYEQICIPSPLYPVIPPICVSV